MNVEFYVNSKIFNFLDRTDKVIALYGGAGAGKSYAIAQWLVLKFISERNKHFLVTRKSNPSLRISAYPLIVSLLDEIHLPYEHNKSEQRIKYWKNEILFRSLDDKEKIKSSEFNYAWMEEATEFTKDDYLQVKLRLRRYTNSVNQLFLSFNPIMVPWIEEEIKRIAALQVTYKDNDYLDDDYKETLENLKNEDETYYKIYTLGQFARVKGLIYDKWEIVDETPEPEFYGLDFGFNNPTALVGCKDGYVKELLYKTHLTNSDLIEELKQLNIHGPIYCDSAEPNRIEELRRAGFEAYPARKEVRDGIDYVKRLRLKINGKNLVEEIKGYKWKEKKNTVLDEPVKFKDHLMDAMRYAFYTHGKQQAPNVRRL